MPDWSKLFARLGYSLEDRLDALKLRMRMRAGFAQYLQILPFRGFGNGEQIYFRGRVLKERGLRPSLEGDRLWHNVLATYRRFHSVEVPGAKVEVRFGNEVHEVLTNEEGYFELYLRNCVPSSNEPWREAEFTLLEPAAHEGKAVTAKGLALVLPKTAKFGVISDIDDTIVVSHARHLLKMTYTVFLRNARGRVPFEGVAAFYSALQKGTSESEFNPIFYVSSGP